MSDQVLTETEAGSTTPDAPANPEAGSALAEDLLSLRGYLERHDVDGAREFVKELEQRWPDSERVQYFARVLAPPVVRPVPGLRGRPLHQEHAWLRAHAREYPRCWLAVFEDRLIAADPSLDTVLDTVRQTPGAENALIHYQHGDSA